MQAKNWAASSHQADETECSLVAVCCFVVSLECADHFYNYWIDRLYSYGNFYFRIRAGCPGESAGYAYLVAVFMILAGLPLSLLSSLFIPTIILGWIRKRRLRRLRRLRRFRS